MNVVEQENACMNERVVNGFNTCKWTPCDNVGYCVDRNDFDYFDEIAAWEKAEAKSARNLLSVELTQHKGGWGNGKPEPTPKPTKPPKTPRPTVWQPPKTTKPPKTPKPTVWQPPKTTKAPKTP